MSFTNLTFSYRGLHYFRKKFTLFQKNELHYSRAKRKIEKYKVKMHRYPESNRGKKFVIELKNEYAQEYCMVGFGSGVMIGDFVLIINHTSVSTRYQIERIYYYFNPPSMWIALMKEK
jgi:hypothetical protein